MPSTTLSDPSEFLRVGSAIFEIIKKEVVLADRIIGYRQRGTLAYGQQAIDVLAAFGDEIDERWLRDRLAREGFLDALEPLKELAMTEKAVTADVLEALLASLRHAATDSP